MLSKNKIKHLQSLSRKKIRDKENVFIAEGTKLVSDLLDAGMEAIEIYATEDNPISSANCQIVSTNEISKISQLKTPQGVFAVFRKKTISFSPEQLNGKLTLVLDSIQDPGNMGTIIRLADWFGIEHIVCSTTTVDLYNPKVIQATMGAIARVKIVYTDLVELLKNRQIEDIPKFATTLKGKNIYQTELPKEAILIMGNEGNGVSNEVARLTSNEILIPSYPADQPTSESLNVAIATAICCAEFRRGN